MDEINYQRDVRLPVATSELERIERELNKFSGTSPEHAREAASALAGISNSRKAYRGFLNGLRDPDLLKTKAQDEINFRALLAQRPDQKETLDAYAQVNEAVQADRDNFKAYQAFERFASRSDLFNMARTLLRAAAERAKRTASACPLTGRAACLRWNFDCSPAGPLYPDLEIFFLADGLDYMLNQYGADDPLVKKVLAGKSPQARCRGIGPRHPARGNRLSKKTYAGWREGDSRQRRSSPRACRHPRSGRARRAQNRRR